MDNNELNHASKSVEKSPRSLSEDAPETLRMHNSLIAVLWALGGIFCLVRVFLRYNAFTLCGIGCWCVACTLLAIGRDRAVIGEPEKEAAIEAKASWVRKFFAFFIGAIAFACAFVVMGFLMLTLARVFSSFFHVSEDTMMLGVFLIFLISFVCAAIFAERCMVRFLKRR